MDGLPVVKGNCAGHIVAEVVSMTDMETHDIILARVKDAQPCTNFTPMTYKYYHEVIKGSAPKNAPTYQEPKLEEQATVTEKWVCTICGYVYEGENPPEKCPQCGVAGSKFTQQGGSELTWAAEHVVGVAKDAPEEIKEGLRANFTEFLRAVGIDQGQARGADVVNHVGVVAAVAPQGDKAAHAFAMRGAPALFPFQRERKVHAGLPIRRR